MLLRGQIKVLFVEDQENFAKMIQLMLEELKLKYIFKAHTMEQAWALFERERPNVCLIDIELSKKPQEGIILAERIREVAPTLPIIFLTVHYNEEMYARCKHVLPSIFMNKELSRLNLYQAIDLALLNTPLTSSPNFKPEEQHLIEETKVPWINHQHFFFKVGDVYKRIAINEIAFFFAKGKMTFARVNSRNFPTNVQLKTLEDELFPKFLRIHKTYLVNVDHIESVSPRDDKIEVKGESLPIGYSYRQSFLEQLKLLK
jgi:DNA-binding LytR/AlgR family response regulator